MKKYKINKNYIVQRTGNKTSIFDSEESILYTLNGTASYIFNLLRKGVAEVEISLRITKQYSINNAQAIKDTKQLVKELKKLNIIISN